MYQRLLIIIISLNLLASCKKSNDPTDVDNSLFDRLYCNDPQAINYNKDFPGTVDNSICFYPRDVFEGYYALKDTIYNAEYEIDTVLDYAISIYALNNTTLRVLGFCPAGDSLKFTADRFYKAQADSLTVSNNVLPGQYTCDITDTLTGFIIKDQVDTTRIRINWTVVSDTGVNYHIGTGKKI